MAKNKEHSQIAPADLPPKLQEQFDNPKTVEFGNGSVAYSVIGESNPEKNPIIVIGGMDNGRVNLIEQAALLAEQGQTQVLITDQPKYNEYVQPNRKRDRLFAVDFLANATIEAAKDAGLIDEDKVVNVAGHSLGGLVASRMHEIAQKQNIQSLLPENGSLTAFLGSSGLDHKEKMIKLGKHWAPYALKGIIEAQTLDPTGEKGKTVIGGFFADKDKSIGEVKALAKNKVSPKLKGAIRIVYPEDHMFPVDEKSIIKSEEHGYEMPVVTPIDPSATTIKGLERAATLAHLKGRKARLDYALSHRGAGHDDPANNPQRTVNVVLGFFENPGNYLGNSQ